MVTKKNLIVVGTAFLMTVVAMPFGVFAQDAVKSEKSLDAAPGTAAVATSDEKARDVIAAREFPDGYLAQRLGAAQRSTKVIGAQIQDTSNFVIAKVNDLLVNLHAGKIYCALVSMKSDDYTVAVPGRCFYPADNKKVVLDMNKDLLMGAPRFATTDWEFAALRKSIGDSYAYFSQKPLWDEKAGLGQINRGTDFIGMEVKDKDDQGLGRVADLMVDLPTARIVFVVVSLDGAEKNVYAVPPEALMLTSDSKVLFLDESKAKVQERVKQDDFFWTEMSDKNWAASTYRSYGVEPDFDMSGAKADPTREQVRAKVEDTPPNKAAGKTDAEITRMILTEMIQGDMGAAFNHKNIKITTVNGRVMLSGHVKNDKQRSKLNEAAESVVGPGYVDNQLEVK